MRNDIQQLPAPDTERWIVRRKAQVVLAVRNGLLTFGEACERYRLSAEELTSWARHFDAYGIKGLRVSRIQEYRT